MYQVHAFSNIFATHVRLPSTLKGGKVQIKPPKAFQTLDLISLYLKSVYTVCNAF